MKGIIGEARGGGDVLLVEKQWDVLFASFSLRLKYDIRTDPCYTGDLPASCLHFSFVRLNTLAKNRQTNGNSPV